MKPILTRFFAGLFLLLAAQASGQTLTTNFVVTSPAGPANYPIGTQLQIELRVSGFTNIAAMQFPIAYNKDVMRFDSLRDAAFSNWNAGYFISVPAQGKIGISWDGFSGGANMPFTFPNGTAIFKLYFTVIGDGTSIVNISAASAPPNVDVTAGNGSNVMLNFQNGGTPTLTLGSGNPPPPPPVGFKIIANTIYIPQGERGCMPVTVNDFDNMISMQWALHWDDAVLNYECSRRFNLVGLSAGEVNPSPVQAATILVAWSDPDVGGSGGVTRADGARIMDVCFKAVGPPGSTSTITIDGMGFDPTAGSAEAYNTSGIDVWTQANHPNGPSGLTAPIHIIVAPPAPPLDVAYSVDTIQAPPGTQGCVAVKVRNFSAVTSAEFALSYDPNELTYNNSPQFGANPLNLQASNFTHVANPGQIKFLWANASGATVANDATIFSLCFNVIAPLGTTADIQFTSTPCPNVTGIGTAKTTGGVSMASRNGWIKSITDGPTITITQALSCNGGNNGSLNVTGAVGTVPTSYSWDGPGITPANKPLQNPTGLTAGTYTVTVTNADGTTGTASEILVAPPAIVATSMVTTVLCNGGNNGAIDLTVTGGTGAYTYNWGGGVSTQDRTGLTVGIYTVTITDANTCTKTATASVSGFLAITPNSVVTGVSCFGLSNGSVVTNPTGGAGNYSYAWSNGASTKDIINVAAGTYTVTVMDGNSCTRTASSTVGTPQAITGSVVGKTDVKCSGTATGTATVTINGGTGNLTYCWNSGAQTCASFDQNPTNLPAGTYTLIVTDQNGCTGTVSNIGIAPAPGAVSVTGSTLPSNCFEQATGSINTNTVGGWGQPHSYAWTGPISPLPSTQNLSNLPGGLYTVSVTDNGGCTTTQTFTVAGAPAITSNAVVQDVTCFGTNDGGINLTLTGGNPPYTVTWTNTTLTGPNIGVLPPNSYQPTVVDVQGCVKVFPAIMIDGPDELTISTNIQEANPNNGSIDLNIISGGTPNFTYQWSNGATTQDLSGLSAGNFSVTITDANDCIRTFNFNVPSGNVLTNTTILSIQNTCSQDGCINFEIPQTAGAFTPFTIRWNNAAPIQSNSFTPSICNLGAGLYNVTITAANGNTMVFSAVSVDQNDPASINSSTTNPFSSLIQNGKIILSKFNGVDCDSLAYQWGPEANNSTSSVLSNLGQGTYSVTITNPCSGCTSVEVFTLEYSPISVILAGVVNPDCASLPTGSIDINPQGGNPPYTFSWEGPNGYTATTEDIKDRFPGTYVVTITDTDNRVEIETYVLTAESNLSITNVNELSQYGMYQVSGNNTCDGVASVAFTPGVGNTTILWSNGVSGPDNTTLCGGAYSVTIMDASGCSFEWTDELTAPAAISVRPEAVSVTCADDCNGTARVFPSGGVGPYSVRWSTGQLDPLVNLNAFSQAVNLCGGDYTVTITDDNDVQFVYTVNVPQPPAIEVSFSSTAPRNFNACDGDVLIQVTGAVEPITYVWSGSFGHTGDGERAEELCSGEFVEYYITDANGCTAYATDSVPYPEDGCFRVSPIITPGQQDGKNDFVIITCIETASENTMEIYNRWGQLVFQTDNYTNNDADRDHNWNGLTRSGAVLAEGVYYYVLTFSYFDDLGQKRDETRKGAINLLK